MSCRWVFASTTCLHPRSPRSPLSSSSFFCFLFRFIFLPCLAFAWQQIQLLSLPNTRCERRRRGLFSSKAFSFSQNASRSNSRCCWKKGNALILLLRASKRGERKVDGKEIGEKQKRRRREREGKEEEEEKSLQTWCWEFSTSGHEAGAQLLRNFVRYFVENFAHQVNNGLH